MREKVSMIERRPLRTRLTTMLHVLNQPSLLLRKLRTHPPQLRPYSQPQSQQRRGHPHLLIQQLILFQPVWPAQADLQAMAGLQKPLHQPIKTQQQRSLNTGQGTRSRLRATSQLRLLRQTCSPQWLQVRADRQRGKLQSRQGMWTQILSRQLTGRRRLQRLHFWKMRMRMTCTSRRRQMLTRQTKRMRRMCR